MFRIDMIGNKRIVKVDVFLNVFNVNNFVPRKIGKNMWTIFFVALFRKACIVVGFFPLPGSGRLGNYSIVDNLDVHLA